jgi:hypothetical protein
MDRRDLYRNKICTPGSLASMPLHQYGARAIGLLLLVQILVTTKKFHLDEFGALMYLTRPETPNFVAN